MKEKINFEKQCNEAKMWVSNISAELRHPDKPEWGYKVLTAVLHTIRDRTTIEEVFHLSAQLPVLIRGIYFESYKPTGKPIKMSSEEFLKSIKFKMGPAPVISATEALRAVLTVLYEKTSSGEMDDIRGLMPKDIQKLWDKLMAAENEME